MTAHSARTVLLVDDDASVRKMLQIALTRAGYSVLVAGDGREALACYEAQADSIHLLITDLRMPHLGGLDLARALRHKWPNLPLVFISGESGLDMLPSAEEFPDHLFFSKPLRPSDLIEQLPKF